LERLVIFIPLLAPFLVIFLKFVSLLELFLKVFDLVVEIVFGALQRRQLVLQFTDLVLVCRCIVLH
jgi:hypothetical protein